MRFRSMTLTVLALAALGCLSSGASAQLETNLGALTDENAKGYMGPLPSAVSGTLNSAIFHTGHVPKSQFGFQIEFHAMTVGFDDDDRLYTPTDPVGFQREDPDGVFEAPTIIGGTQHVEQAGEVGTKLFHPGGFDLDNFTLAVPQLTIGSFYGTRAAIRWISLDLGDADLGELDLFGIGIQHSITQYFVEPPIDVALGGFFQQFDIGDKIVDSQMLQVMLMGSKKYGMVEPYVGIGYDTFDMEVEYVRDEGDIDADVAVDFDPEDNAHLTTGVRLNLTNVMVHAEFNAAAETGFAIGLSFGM